ncbi:hypothetical protein JI664_08440 [Rhodobacter sp. NTK016B]|uniref:hypothetical protein n=1 Tax=Rhodobacter sp. NTK016B TaxID=2759676 RepID=UPI001A8C73C1|nr:hypothetical protein [Rhodobacter sp. NTK016B]MBN8291987.1 hypothetical protein [Rhodobacter sp. NTK016B]
MNRFAISATVAFVALGAVAANASDLAANGVTNRNASNAAEVTSNGQIEFRAGDVYTTRELVAAGLEASDIVEVGPRKQVEVRAGDVYSSRELQATGLNASDVLTVNDYSADAGNRPFNVTR